MCLVYNKNKGLNVAVLLQGALAGFVNHLYIYI